ncbi:MAG: hypothetical protein AB7W37_09220 [Syntrophobacteraceae bacterium]
MKEVLLEISQPDSESVLRCLGYGHASEPHPEVLELVRECSAEALELPGMPGAYALLPIDGVDPEGIRTEKGIILSRKLAGVARGAGSLAFALVSAGRAFDERLASADGLLGACVWDAIGTVLVEDGVERLLRVIGDEAGCGVSLPFSPGYCDWDLEGQGLVFSVFPPSPIGISLMEGSLMMEPQKSVSFVACVGVEMKPENPCRSCTLKKCFMRRSS